MQEGMSRKGDSNDWIESLIFLQSCLDVKVVSCLNFIKSTNLVVQI